MRRHVPAMWVKDWLERASMRRPVPAMQGASPHYVTPQRQNFSASRFFHTHHTQNNKFNAAQQQCKIVVSRGDHLTFLRAGCNMPRHWPERSVPRKSYTPPEELAMAGPAPPLHTVICFLCSRRNVNKKLLFHHSSPPSIL